MNRTEKNLEKAKISEDNSPRAYIDDLLQDEVLSHLEIWEMGRNQITKSDQKHEKIKKSDNEIISAWDTELDSEINTIPKKSSFKQEDYRIKNFDKKREFKLTKRYKKANIYQNRSRKLRSERKSIRKKIPGFEQHSQDEIEIRNDQRTLKSVRNNFFNLDFLKSINEFYTSKFSNSNKKNNSHYMKMKNFEKKNFYKGNIKNQNSMVNKALNDNESENIFGKIQGIKSHMNSINRVLRNSKKQPFNFNFLSIKNTSKDLQPINFFQEKSHIRNSLTRKGKLRKSTSSKKLVNDKRKRRIYSSEKNSPIKNHGKFSKKKKKAKKLRKQKILQKNRKKFSEKIFNNNKNNLYQNKLDKRLNHYSVLLRGSKVPVNFESCGKDKNRTSFNRFKEKYNHGPMNSTDDILKKRNLKRKKFRGNGSLKNNDANILNWSNARNFRFTSLKKNRPVTRQELIKSHSIEKSLRDDFKIFNFFN